MEFGFEIVHRPGKCYKAAEAVYRLPQKWSEKEKKNADVDVNIPTYCVVGQIRKLNKVFIENEDKIRPLLTTKELMETAKILKRY